MQQTKTDLSALNEPQREAVTSQHKRLLVLAGAGSGKTKTLLQKVMYLIEEKGINPSEILAITFTKNAANEMTDRLLCSADHTEMYERILTDKRISGSEKATERFKWTKRFAWIDSLTLRTFHSLCYTILRNYGVNQFDNKFRLIGEDKKPEADEFTQHTAPEISFDVFYKNLISLCENTTYLLDLKRYVLDYLVDRIHLEDKRVSLPKEGKYFTTLNGDKVRSKSEQFIADWLYRHSIPYEYEPLLNIKDFYFRPDFYIPAANLYLEHVSDKSYPTWQKEEQFDKGGIHFVKTYESITQDSALFNHTLDSIIKNRLPENYQQTANLQFREEFNRYGEEVKDFLRDVMRIMDMMKVENIPFWEVLHRAMQDQHERIRSFYGLAIPLIEAYTAYCTNKSYLDFNDLMLQTIQLFRNHKDIREVFQKRFRYILVDEFQDVNSLQVELLKLMLTPETQLFCVGDDWQSIYGFRGSNVGYIVEFEKHFENSATIKLDLNYRSTENIVGASNEVIRHNRFKVDKEIRASKKSEHKIVVFTGNTEEENLDFCIARIRELLDDGIQPDEMLFLYRRSKMFTPYYLRLRKEGLAIPGKTIHAAKGLEAKVVFILGMTDGSGGFPDIWLEDRIFQVIKQADHDLLMEEERRLFYVAITRAKDKLYLITEKGKESRFLKEIPENYTVKTSAGSRSMVAPVRLCPGCSSQLEKLFKYCPYCGAQTE